MVVNSLKFILLSEVILKPRSRVPSLFFQRLEVFLTEYIRHLQIKHWQKLCVECTYEVVYTERMEERNSQTCKYLHGVMSDMQKCLALKRGSFKCFVISYFIFQLDNGSSVLRLAVECNEFSNLDILLEHGADINEVDLEQGSILQTLLRATTSCSVEETLEWTACLFEKGRYTYAFLSSSGNFCSILLGI